MLQDILFSICTRTGWDLQTRADGSFRVTVRIKGGIRQPVTIAFVDDERTGLRWARYVSRLGSAGDLDADLCLRVNASLSLTTGAIGRVDDDLVFIDTQLCQDADEREVEESITNVARGAARVDDLVTELGGAKDDEEDA